MKKLFTSLVLGVPFLCLAPIVSAATSPPDKPLAIKEADHKFKPAVLSLKSFDDTGGAKLPQANSYHLSEPVTKPTLYAANLPNNQPALT